MVNRHFISNKVNKDNNEITSHSYEKGYSEKRKDTISVQEVEI